MIFEKLPQLNQAKIEKPIEKETNDSPEIFDYSPEKIINETPILFAPGWSNTPLATGRPLKILSEDQGRRVLSVSHTRTLEIAAGPNEFAKEELQKALALIGAIEKSNIKIVDAVGYSEGALNLLIAATLFPEKFRNIVLVEPSGMVGKESSLNLIKNLGVESVFTSLEIYKNPERIFSATKVLSDLLIYIAKNPSLAKAELKAVSEADLYRMLKDLKDKGMNISIVSGVDDKVISMEKIQENAQKNELGNFIDGFYSVKGGHAEIILQPEKYMPFIGEALNALEYKGKIQT